MRIHELLEAKVGEITAGEYRVVVDDHALDRARERNVNPHDVDGALKKLSTINDQIDAVGNKLQFFVIDQNKGITLGMRKLGDRRVLLKTVIKTVKPYARNVDDIFTV